jgi:hypothetical protein
LLKPHVPTRQADFDVGLGDGESVEMKIEREKEAAS